MVGESRVPRRPELTVQPHQGVGQGRHQRQRMRPVFLRCSHPLPQGADSNMAIVSQAKNQGEKSAIALSTEGELPGSTRRPDRYSVGRRRRWPLCRSPSAATGPPSAWRLTGPGATPGAVDGRTAPRRPEPQRRTGSQLIRRGGGCACGVGSVPVINYLHLSLRSRPLRMADSGATYFSSIATLCDSATVATTLPLRKSGTCRRTPPGPDPPDDRHRLARGHGVSRIAELALTTR